MESPALFRIDVPHGTLVGVRVDAVDVASLHREEAAHAATFSDERRRTFAAGRAAMRLALAACGVRCDSILADARGAPILPDGLSGSISHKESVAVALVGEAGEWRVGVDVEIDRERAFDISRRILTETELEDLAGLDDRERARHVLRRFSLKEAIYKAIDPFLRRYVGFREVALGALPPDSSPHVRGRGEETWFLVVATFREAEPALEIEVALREQDSDVGTLILSSARARPSLSPLSPSGERGWG